tara:strand:- start:2985 stop:8471 length:5487 start_codon:yes stop_codon:yes gene_type:complete
MLKGVRGNLHSIIFVGLIVLVFAGLFYSGITGFYTSPFGGPTPFGNFDQFDSPVFNLSLYQLTLVVGDPGVQGFINASVNSNLLFNVSHTGATSGGGPIRLYINTNIQQTKIYTYINMTDTSSTVSASAEASSGIEFADDVNTYASCYLNLANTSQFRLIASNITGPAPYANVPTGIGNLSMEYIQPTTSVNCTYRWGGGVVSLLIPMDLNVQNAKPMLFASMNRPPGPGPVNATGEVVSYFDFWNVTGALPPPPPPPPVIIEEPYFETFTGPVLNVSRFTAPNPVLGFNFSQSNNMIVMNGTAVGLNAISILDNANNVNVVSEISVESVFNLTGSVANAGSDAATYRLGSFANPTSTFCSIALISNGNYVFCADGNCTGVPKGNGNLTYGYNPGENLMTCTYTNNVTIISRTSFANHSTITIRNSLTISNVSDSGYLTIDDLNYSVVAAPPECTENSDCPGEQICAVGSCVEEQEGFGMCSSFYGNQVACLNSTDNVVCSWLNAGQSWCSPMGGGCCDQVSCESLNGNRNDCNSFASDLGCSWSDNQLNQNMWCPISGSNPYKSNGMPVSGTNIGCCASQECSDATGTNQTYCNGTETSFMNGICTWETQTQNPFCPDATGCCGLPECGDVSIRADCEYLISQGQSCSWSGSACSSGGYESYNGADSCVSSGGSWNGTACETPDYTEEASNARCWFADNQENVCGNITGCVYCVAGTGYAGIANESSYCYNKQAGWCEGHAPGAFAEGDSEAMTCSDVQLGVTCDCGPVPGCHWTNSSATTGSFCSSGVPACELDYESLEFQQCEDATTSGDCSSLATDYFLPCTWDSSLSECLFDFMSAGTGDQKGNMDFEFEDILDQENCQFAGGVWNSVVLDSYGNTDSWCDFGFGAGMDTCNNSCWACETQSDGTAWGTSSLAQNECETSNAVVGGCEFISFGGTQGMGDRWGWCDYPSGIEFFGGSCETMCYDCFDEDMCTTSAADCGWVSDSYGGGWCDPSSIANLQDPTLTCLAAKTESDCGTLTDETLCQWNSTYVTDPFTGDAISVCIEDGASPEICFISGDEDGNGLADCQDSVCSSDPMCGFGMGFGGEMMSDSFMLPPGMESDLCYAYDDTNQSTCEAYVINETLAFNGSTRGFAALPAHLNNQILCYYHAAPSGAQETNWCDPVFHEMMMGDMDNAPPVMLGSDAIGDASSIDSLDIVELGIKNEVQKMIIGVPVVNITDFAGCNKKISGNSTQNGTFYRYLDTDDNAATGCTANGGSEGDADLDGYDYKIAMQGTWNGTDSNNVLSAYECADSSANTWMPKSAALTFKDDFCLMDSGINAVVLTKNDFAIDTDNLRIYITTVFDDENTPIDTLGPFYFTPGSIDFMKEDCFGFVDLDGDGDLPSDDADCSFINNLGFMPFEDCGDGLDNNADGLTDCDDYMCTFTPMCDGDFGFTASGTDNTAPQIVFHTIDTFDDSAFVKFDSNEPANGSVLFYYNDSTCASLNKSLHDTGDPSCTGSWCDFDDYKLWHDLPIDNFAATPAVWKLGYDLSNGTTYFYRYNVCDPDSNCATSACVNFTTEGTQPQYYFDMEPPTGFSVKTPWATGGQEYAQQVNISVAKDIDINITCADTGYEIRLVGVDIKDAQDLDVSGLVCSGTTGLIGMSSTLWNQLLFGLSLDYVEVTWAVEEDATTAQHCDDNGLNCVAVNDYLDCTTSDTSWTCKIPLTLGFSTYKVITPTGEVASATVSGGGGSGSVAEGSSDEEEEEEEDPVTEVIDAVVDDVAETVDEGVQRVSEFVGDVVGEDVVQNTWVWIVVGGLVGLGVVSFVVLKKVKFGKGRKIKKH